MYSPETDAPDLPPPIEYYIEKAKVVLLEKYPELTFSVRKRSHTQAFLYFDGPYDLDEDGFEMMDAAGDVMADAGVDYRYLLHVTPGR